MPKATGRAGAAGKDGEPPPPAVSLSHLEFLSEREQSLPARAENDAAACKKRPRRRVPKPDRFTDKGPVETMKWQHIAKKRRNQADAERQRKFRARRKNADAAADALLTLLEPPPKEEEVAAAAAGPPGAENPVIGGDLPAAGVGHGDEAPAADLAAPPPAAAAEASIDAPTVAFDW